MFCLTRSNEERDLRLCLYSGCKNHIVTDQFSLIRDHASHLQPDNFTTFTEARLRVKEMQSVHGIQAPDGLMQKFLNEARWTKQSFHLRFNELENEYNMLALEKLNSSYNIYMCLVNNDKEKFKQQLDLLPLLNQKEIYLQHVNSLQILTNQINSYIADAINKIFSYVKFKLSELKKLDRSLVMNSRIVDDTQTQVIQDNEKLQDRLMMLEKRFDEISKQRRDEYQVKIEALNQELKDLNGNRQPFEENERMKDEDDKRSIENREKGMGTLDYEQLFNKYIQVQEENRRLQEQIFDIQKDRIQLRKQLHSQIKCLENTQNEYKRDRIALVKMIEMSNYDIASLRNSNEALQNQITSLQSQLQSIYSNDASQLSQSDQSICQETQILPQEADLINKLFEKHNQLQHKNDASKRPFMNQFQSETSEQTLDHNLIEEDRKQPLQAVTKSIPVIQLDEFSVRQIHKNKSVDISYEYKNVLDNQNLISPSENLFSGLFKDNYQPHEDDSYEYDSHDGRNVKLLNEITLQKNVEVSQQSTY